MNYLKFSKQLLVLWLVRLTLLFALLTVGGWFLREYNKAISNIILIILGALYLLLALYFWLYCRTRRYALRKGQLIFIRGVIFRRTTVVPLMSTMLLVRVEPPLSRIFGLCGILLRGGRLMIFMEGLTRGQAYAISAALE